MDKSYYSLEDPVEYSIGAIGQVGMRRIKLEETPLPAAPESPLCVDGFLAELGSVVAYEREDGSMALTTWEGETVNAWVKFDISPRPALIYMRKHMIEAVPLHLPRPEGFIRVICFKRKQ